MAGFEMNGGRDVRPSSNSTRASAPPKPRSFNERGETLPWGFDPSRGWDGRDAILRRV